MENCWISEISIVFMLSNRDFITPVPSNAVWQVFEQCGGRQGWRIKEKDSIVFLAHRQRGQCRLHKKRRATQWQLVIGIAAMGSMDFAGITM